MMTSTVVAAAIALQLAQAVPTPGDMSKSVAPLVDRVKASVVSIRSTKFIRRFVPEDAFSRLFRDFGVGGAAPRQERETQQGLGSGFIYDAAQGLVLTNNHVVAGADQVLVILPDDRQLDAQVVGTDSQTDVAVVRISRPPRDLRAVRIGDSERVRVGDYVLAIGNPLGLGQTVTMGIVSAKNRAVGKLVDYEDFIQTDAAINQGNSGGPLFNFDGEVIGINSAILNPAMAMNVGFAIPINLARQVGQQIAVRGRVARGFLGVRTSDLPAQEGRRLGIAVGGGALVNEVTLKSPAALAGLRPNDVIVEVAGRRVDSQARLGQVIASRTPGETVAIVAYRGGQRFETRAAITENQELLNGTEILGLRVEQVAQQELAEFEVPAALRVLAVDRRSPGAGQLREGDVIVGIQISTATQHATMAALKTLALRLDRGGSGRLILVRGGQPYVLRLG